MAQSVDLTFLGEQMRQMQSDLRQVRADQLRMESEQVQSQERLARVEAKLNGLEGQLDAFRETVDDRFDQTIEFLKASFRTLSGEIQELKRS